MKLPNTPRPKLKICIIGNAAHCEQAKANGIPSIDVDGLKKFNKERKLIKKWAKPYAILLASDSLMKQIPRILGNTLNKIGKFPSPIGENEQVLDKVEEAKATVKF